MSHQLLTIMPAMLGVILVFLFAAPMDGGAFNLAPNVAWLMTLSMVAYYPAAWPRGLAFALGLLQDLLLHTPPGSQALLALLLVQLVQLQHQRQQTQLFRIRWMEVAGVLVLWHVLLWMLMLLVAPGSASLRHMVQAGVVSALWYPLFYWVTTRAFAALPDAR